MDDSTLAPDIETSMEYMKFCMYVIDKEMLRFNLDSTVYQTFVTQLPGVLDVNFDIAYNRCAFMYKYTLCNLYFFKDCMKKFISEYPDFNNLVSKWRSDSNISLCSLSCGPGLDYLSFMLALSDHLSPPSFKSVTILSKHGAWRNTVGIVADALHEGILSESGIGKLVNFQNTEVVQTNLLISIPTKGLEALQHSRVVLMVKALNLTAPGTNDEEIMKTKVLGLISSLKPETTIFFIDTKPSLALFSEILSKFEGQFLFKPEHLSFRVPVTFSEEYKERNGCLPVVCSRGAFLVWQKLSSFEPVPNFNISPIKPPTDVIETVQNSLDKSSNENIEVSNITKTLKDLILPNNTSLLPSLTGNVLLNSQISGNNKCLQPTSIANVFNVSHTNNNISESVSATSSLANTPKKLEINKPASIQTLLTSQSVQDLPLINFDEKSCSSYSLKKSSSIDNCFFQGSSKSMSFLGESDLRLNSLPSSTIEEAYPTSSPQYKVNKKELSENKNKKNVPQSNQVSKPTSESKATQTELHQSVTNSSVVKGLTERVKRLVSSLENEVQKNISGDQVNCQMHESPDRCRNYSTCSTNCCNNSNTVMKPQCCNNYQAEGGAPMSCCHSVHMNQVHCCAVRPHMMHRCEMHCWGSCVHRCHVNPHRPFCENNIAAIGTSSAQPQIVIPLQNVSNDLLLQIISAAKSGSKTQ